MSKYRYDLSLVLMPKLMLLMVDSEIKVFRNLLFVIKEPQRVQAMELFVNGHGEFYNQ